MLCVGVQEALAAALKDKQPKTVTAAAEILAKAVECDPHAPLDPAGPAVRRSWRI